MASISNEWQSVQLSPISKSPLKELLAKRASKNRIEVESTSFKRQDLVLVVHSCQLLLVVERVVCA